MKLLFRNAALLFGLIGIASQVRAETITIGLVGSASATHWPIYVGLKKGYYADANIKLDMIFTPSSGALVQQFASRPIDLLGFPIEPGGSRLCPRDNIIVGGDLLGS